MEAVEETYKLTGNFPDRERYGLTSQMRRAALSIPSNVAEGQVIRAVRWSLRHVIIAIGSSAELDTQLEAAVRLHFVDENAAKPLRALLERVQQVLYGLRREKERRLQVGASAIAIIFFLSASVVG